MNDMTTKIPQFTKEYKKMWSCVNEHGNTSNKKIRIRKNSPAGGRSEALIATPTRLDVESSNTDKATPRPEKNAIGNCMKCETKSCKHYRKGLHLQRWRLTPDRKVTLEPRLLISGVGQSVAIWVQNVVAPINSGYKSRRRVLVNMNDINVHQIYKLSTRLLPKSIPKIIHAKMESSSFLADLFIKGKSQMMRP